MLVCVIYNKQAESSWGEACGQWSGRDCCFWRAACFCAEVIAWNGRCVQSFLLKAHDPQILSRGKKDFFCGASNEHTIFPRDITSQLSSCCFVAPPQLTSAPLNFWLSSIEWKACVPWRVCVCHKHWIQDNTSVETSTNTAFSLFGTRKLTLVCFTGFVWNKNPKIKLMGFKN